MAADMRALPTVGEGGAVLLIKRKLQQEEACQHLYNTDGGGVVRGRWSSCRPYRPLKPSTPPKTKRLLRASVVTPAFADSVGSLQEAPLRSVVWFTLAG